MQESDLSTRNERRRQILYPGYLGTAGRLPGFRDIPRPLWEDRASILGGSGDVPFPVSFPRTTPFGHSFASDQTEPDTIRELAAHHDLRSGGPN